MTLESISVYVIEDDPIILESLKQLLTIEDGFFYGGGVMNAEEAISELREVTPDVVLLDISMPGMSGLEFLQEINKIKPDLNILIFTVHEDTHTVFSALRLGAVGYILKGADPEMIFNSIKEVQRGGAPISPAIARLVIDSFKLKNQTELTDREMEVLKMLSDGSNNVQIANTLHISRNTVKAHVKNIYKKLHVNSRAAAVKEAYTKGLLK